MKPNTPPTAVDVARFARANILADAGLSGYEHAQNIRLPRIPDRWRTPELRDAWIGGFVTELRNRLEAENSHEPA